MSLLRKTNNIEFYAVPNQHWIVCAEYPFYKDMEKFFDFRNEDISKGSCTVQGLQRPTKDEEWERKRLLQGMVPRYIFQIQVPNNTNT